MFHYHDGGKFCSVVIVERDFVEVTVEGIQALRLWKMCECSDCAITEHVHLLGLLLTVATFPYTGLFASADTGTYIFIFSSAVCSSACLRKGFTIPQLNSIFVTPYCYFSVCYKPGFLHSTSQ